MPGKMPPEISHRMPYSTHSHTHNYTHMAIKCTHKMAATAVKLS